MATLLADLCGCDSICLKDWDDKDWDEFITDFSELYQVLIRKDASHFFVPRLLEKGEVEFSTDSVTFRTVQKTFKNRNVDIKLKKQINNQFREIIAILKFQRAFSIIRCHIENVLDAKDEEGLKEESVIPDEIAHKYINHIHALFADCTNAKKALVSLVSREEENGDKFKLYIKKPSELNIHFKNTSFRQYYNLQNLQDRFDDVVRNWEGIVLLPIPTNQTIGKYTFPEVRLAQTNDEENDDTDDENEGQLSGSDDAEKQHDSKPEVNDDEDYVDVGCNFHTQDETPAKNQGQTQIYGKNQCQAHMYEEIWNLRLKDLHEYKRKFGDCVVPRKCPSNLVLGNWVNTQRTEYKYLQDGQRSKMTLERLRLLEGVEFVWNMNTYRWNLKLQELKVFFEINGHTNVPERGNHISLAQWIRHQRYDYKNYFNKEKAHMDEERLLLLQKAGLQLE
jgi:hypothetical protein